MQGNWILETAWNQVRPWKTAISVKDCNCAAPVLPSQAGSLHASAQKSNPADRTKAACRLQSLRAPGTQHARLSADFCCGRVPVWGPPAPRLGGHAHAPQAEDTWLQPRSLCVRPSGHGSTVRTLARGHSKGGRSGALAAQAEGARLQLLCAARLLRMPLVWHEALPWGLCEALPCRSQRLKVHPDGAWGWHKAALQAMRKWPCSASYAKATSNSLMIDYGYAQHACECHCQNEVRCHPDRGGGASLKGSIIYLEAAPACWRKQGKHAHLSKLQAQGPAAEGPSQEGVCRMRPSQKALLPASLHKTISNQMSERLEAFTEPATPSVVLTVSFNIGVSFST